MSGISVIIIVKDRCHALINTIEGLCRGQMLPAELIVVHMNEAPYVLPKTPLNTKSVIITSDHAIPLAAARNEGRKHAAYEKLVFLDVDCIPSSMLIADYNAACDSRSLISGMVRYLSKPALTNVKLFDAMEELSTPDPVRAGLLSVPYELFWSLNFGCSKQVFDTIGGFDEKFKGYGAEDTDFAFQARVAGVPVSTINAKAYHQYHESYSPPLNHLKDIIINARRFYEKWSLWPMEGWLSTFQDMGLINRDAYTIEWLRPPTQQELKQCLKR